MSPKLPALSSPPAASSHRFHSDTCPSSPLDFASLSPVLCPEAVWAATASRRLGPSTLPAAAPGAVAGPGEGNSPRPARMLRSEPFGRGRSRGIAVGDCGVWFLFCWGGLLFPFFSLFFPPTPFSQSQFLFYCDKFNMTLDFLCPARRPCF